MVLFERLIAYRLRRITKGLFLVPETFAGSFDAGTSVISPQNFLPDSLSVKQTVLVSSGGFCTTSFLGVFAAFLGAGADDESAALVVAFLLLFATGSAVFVTAFLRLAMMGKILGVKKNAIEGMSQPLKI
jgi:hypothetical protein